MALSHYEKLDWDSNFFKTNVFKTTESSAEQIEALQKRLPSPSILYIFSDKHIPVYETALVDNKVVFELSVADLELAKEDDSCVFYDGKNMTNQELEYLSIVSSGLSRFRKDKKFSEDDVDHLYKIWIHNAIKDLSGHKIIGTLTDGHLSSMMSLKLQDRMIKIELVATHPNHQRQGLASRLMEKCFLFAKTNNYEKIQVITQMNNLKACEFYSKYGFNIVSQTYIYHLHK